MDIRLTAALLAGKTAGFAARRLGRGGTALPGLIACSLDANIVAKLGRQIPTRVLVTGTNGKTTTCRALSSILEQARHRFVHNREGSNLTRGFASTLLDRAALGGSLPSIEIGLFETDEATLPDAVDSLRPEVIAFTNLFRDQLDRYGEVDTVAGIWRRALADAPPTTTLVLNADDPLTAALADEWPGPVHFFGLELPEAADAEQADARWCPECGNPIAYDLRYFAHVGRWRCDSCNRRAPAPDTLGRSIQLDRNGATFEVDGWPGELRLDLAGAYNVYNAVAAIAVGQVIGVPDEDIRAGLTALAPAFGRQEMIQYRGRLLRFLLSKNPAGANRVLGFLRDCADDEQGLKTVVLLNDRFADSRDVSWIWDVNYEQLAPHISRYWTGGLRAEEMALRLRYAGWPQASGTVRDPGGILEALVAGTGEGEEIFVLPTYTSMLDLRAALVDRGAVSPYWERRK